MFITLDRECCFEDRPGESDDSQFNENSPSACWTVATPDPVDVPSPTKSELMDECKHMVEAFRRRRQRLIDAEYQPVAESSESESEGNVSEEKECPILPEPKSDAEFHSPGTLSRSTLPRWTPSQPGTPSSSVCTDDIDLFDKQACPSVSDSLQIHCKVSQSIPKSRVLGTWNLGFHPWV